ncbi:MAG: prolipoprotein diacylglyceryl transferase [Planctomycetota bacterium]|jgi:phosphatidylglycerol:prolipoprotein diacylglycerol transferase|nr:prolipoprotein diacylglyceryl transferase [Planctomycetota bacterium]
MAETENPETVKESKRRFVCFSLKVHSHPPGEIRMRPVLLELPIGHGFHINSFGVFLVLGFVFGLVIAHRRAITAGLPKNAVLDVGLISAFAGIVAARVSHMLFVVDVIEGDYGGIKEWLGIWDGGLTLYAGGAVACLFSLLYLEWNGLPAGKTFDACAPAAAVSLGIGRIGCLLNGCCWGLPAPNGFPLAMIFPRHLEPMSSQENLFTLWPEQWADFLLPLGYPPGTPPPVPIYATQFAAIAGMFTLATGLIVAERICRRRGDGQIAIWFMLAYGAGSFIMEAYRGESAAVSWLGTLCGLLPGQWLSLATIAIGCVFQLRLLLRGRAEAIDLPPS